MTERVELAVHDDQDELERGVIGALLLANSVERVSVVRELVAPHDFTDAMLGDAYRVILRAVERDGVVPDGVLLSRELTDDPPAPGRSWKYGDVAPTLVTLGSEAALSALLPRYCTQMRRNASERRVRLAVLEVANSSGATLGNMVAQLKQVLEGVNLDPGGEVLTFEDALRLWGEEARALRASGGGLLTGWPTLDRHLGPWRPGHVVIYAARSGVGKSWSGSTAIQFNLQRLPDLAALFCTLEMPGAEAVERMTMQMLGIDVERARMLAAEGEITMDALRDQSPIVDRVRFWEKPVTITSLPGVIRKARRTGVNPKLVVVDYLGLIGWDGDPRAKTYEKASENARRLKEVAKAEGVTILCLAQLNREGGTDGTTKPFLHHLRDSGAIEEAADKIVGFWKTGEHPADPWLGATILKNRGGPQGPDVDLMFGKGMQLTEVAR